VSTTNGTDPVTGTTGAAGRLMIASMASTTAYPRGRLVLENRRGWTVHVNVALLAGGI